MTTPFNSLRALLCLTFLSLPLMAATPGGRTYQVLSGDTLDKVIRQTMPNSPLKIEILRNAFIQQNPQAFTKSPPRVLMAGSVIVVPNHDDLLRSYVSGGNRAYGVRGGGYSTADLDMNERKNWVRFP